MRRFALPLALCIAASLAGTSAVAGWGKTNWGMTREQVTATYPSAKVQTERVASGRRSPSDSTNLGN